MRALVHERNISALTNESASSKDLHGRQCGEMTRRAGIKEGRVDQHGMGNVANNIEHCKNRFIDGDRFSRIGSGDSQVNVVGNFDRIRRRIGGIVRVIIVVIAKRQLMRMKMRAKTAVVRVLVRMAKARRRRQQPYEHQGEKDTRTKHVMRINETRNIDKAG
jgi:hypothetical protein